MIIEFKNKKQKFKDWFQAIIKENDFKNSNIENALFIWETPPTKEGYQIHNCRFNCDLEQLKYYHRQLGEYIKEWEFDKYLTEHIQDYIELL